jgi:hypothetical protein
MTITIVGGGNPSGPTYPLQRSVRLRSSATAYFNRTFGTPTSNTTWTWSGWVKRGTLGAYQVIFCGDDGSSNNFLSFRFSNTDTLECYQIASGSYNLQVATSAVFRDPSAWYHVVFVYNSGNATSTSRVQIYVNGVLQAVSYTIGPFALNTASQANVASRPHAIGRILYASVQYFDGYHTEVNFIDGQALTPTSFGAYNSYGVWSPAKYSGSYGTNGFYLNFQDNSGATATTIGKDSSGNGNNWTPNNISVTAGVTYDSMLDVPTNTSPTNANFAVMNPLPSSSYRTLSNGNLRSTGNTATNSGMSVASIGVSTGKIVWEETITTTSGSFPGVGATTVILSDGNGQNPAASNTQGVYYRANGEIYKNSSSLVGTYTTLTNGTVVRFELDADALTCAIYRNNTLIVTVTGLTAGTFYPSNVNYNSSVTDTNFGQQPFVNTPNTGFNRLNTYNLPTPTIPNGAAQMAATTYTGTGAALSVSNAVNSVSFQPDFVWVKGRSGATDHALYDSVRGTTKQLESNTITAETTEATGLTAFGSSGFTVGALAQMNTNAATYVGWQWKANGTPAVTNTSGSIPSTISANTTSGFSIVTWTGTGANATVGHGIGVAPKMIIVFNRAGGYNIAVYNSNIGATNYLYLDLTTASAVAASLWNNTAPTSSVFSIGTSGAVNNSAQTYVAYCWAEIPGFSKFGSYTGNGSTDGPFVYTGMRPRWVMIKRTDTTGDWVIWDTSRNTYNAAQNGLYPNLSVAEGNSYFIDVLSNGFKLRMSTIMNVSSGTYIYAAFAENPFNYSLAR